MGFFKNEQDTSDSGPSTTTKPFTKSDILICGSYGNIYAIHKTDGSRLWKTSFKSNNGIISLFVMDNYKLIAGANGRTACLDLMKGTLIWENSMPGLGYEEVSIASTPSKALNPNVEQSSTMELPPHYEDSILPPTMMDDMEPENPIIVACSKGKVMGIDSESGETLWTYNCPGGRYNVPVVLVEPANMGEGRLRQLAYIGAAKWVYCLKTTTGAVVWTVKVASGLFGADFMTLATAWSSRLAAESHSGFNQNPSAQSLEIQREKQRRNAASRSNRGIGKSAFP